MTVNFVALDVETANSFRGSLCSIGLVKFSDGNPIDTFYTLINPQEDFDSYNVLIHGITPEMTENSPTFKEVYPKIIDFIDSYAVVAHFAQFDMYAILDACRKYNINPGPIKYIDSYNLSKRVVKDTINYKLSTLSELFGINLNHHNALSDASACGQITKKLFELTESSSIDELLNTTGYKIGVLGQRGFRQKVRRKYRPTKFYQPTEQEIEQMNPEHPFYGLHFTFTGKLKRMTRVEAAKAVALIGGLPDKGVTKSTNVLVVGEQDWHVVGESGLSSKMKKANDLLNQGQEIEILTEDDFLKLL